MFVSTFYQYWCVASAMCSLRRATVGRPWPSAQHAGWNLGYICSIYDIAVARGNLR